MSVIILLGVLCCHLASIEASDHVTCQPGTGLPIILSAPHGGYLEEQTIPDRDHGCYINNECVWRLGCGVQSQSECRAVTLRDRYTQEQAWEMYHSMCAAFGACPWVAVNNLARIKLDANREINEAAFGDPVAIAAYHEYMDCLDYAHGNVTQQNGKGLQLGLHGHSHPEVRVELGYLVSSSRLNSNTPLAKYSSIKSLDQSVSITFEQLLRGQNSFGDILERAGYDAIPSPDIQAPGTAKYFTGGYIARKYGSRYEGTIDSIQIESPIDFRNNQARPNYIAALTSVIRDFLNIHYGFSYP